MQINNKEFNITPEELEKVLKPYEVKKNWVPVYGEKYFYIDDCGGSKWSTFTIDSNDIDDFRLSVGNWYQTKDLAEKAIAIKQALVKVNNRIDELNGSWEPDWDDGIQCKYRMTYKYNHKKFEKDTWSYNINNPFIHACALSEIAEQIISELNDELKLIWGV